MRSETLKRERNRPSGAAAVQCSSSMKIVCLEQRQFFRRSQSASRLLQISFRSSEKERKDSSRDPFICELRRLLDSRLAGSFSAVCHFPPDERPHRRTNEEGRPVFAGSFAPTKGASGRRQVTQATKHRKSTKHVLTRCKDHSEQDIPPRAVRLRDVRYVQWTLSLFTYQARLLAVTELAPVQRMAKHLGGRHQSASSHNISAFGASYKSTGRRFPLSNRHGCMRPRRDGRPMHDRLKGPGEAAAAALTVIRY